MDGIVQTTVMFNLQTLNNLVVAGVGFQASSVLEILPAGLLPFPSLNSQTPPRRILAIVMFSSTQDENMEPLMLERLGDAEDFEKAVVSAPELKSKQPYRRVVIWAVCVPWALVAVMLLIAVFGPHSQKGCPSTLLYSEFPVLSLGPLAPKSPQVEAGSSLRPSP